MGHHHLVLDVGEDSFLIDCGMLMPAPGQVGVERITPSFEPALARVADGSLRGLLLTHGHLDHIGAVPDLLAAVPDLPVYGSPWTLALVERRLGRDGKRLSRAPALRPVRPGVDVTVGGCAVRWLSVTHSLPDACSVAVRGEAGCVVHSGDFRVQDEPLLGEPIDAQGLADIGAEGVDLALIDSTGGGSAGSTVSERVLADRLQSAVKGVEGYAVVTIFSSHMERLWACVLAARATDRRVCVLGRSLVETVELARSRGLLPLRSGELLPSDRLASTPRSKVLLVVTGTQGEWRAPLARMARGEDSKVSLGPGDAVFWSARVIPGEERSVGSAVNRLIDRGVRVVPPWGGEEPLHTSGHARADEVARWLSWVKPRCVAPIHGEAWHLQSHREALSRLMRSEQILSVRSGQRLERAGRTGSWSLAPVEATEATIHGVGGQTFSPSDRALAHRRRAAHAGAMTVLVRWVPGEPPGAPHVITIGIVPEARRRAFEAELEAAVTLAVEQGRPAPDLEARREQVRLLARSAVRSRTGTRPMCTVRLLS